jgi:hypothetical protein
VLHLEGWFDIAIAAERQQAERKRQEEELVAMLKQLLEDQHSEEEATDRGRPSPLASKPASPDIVK